MELCYTYFTRRLCHSYINISGCICYFIFRRHWVPISVDRLDNLGGIFLAFPFPLGEFIVDHDRIHADNHAVSLLATGNPTRSRVSNGHNLISASCSAIYNNSRETVHERTVLGLICMEFFNVFNVYLNSRRWFMLYLVYMSYLCWCWSQWPRGLKHELSSPAQALGLWVRISLEAWMFVCVYSVFVLSCVGSGLATGWSPVQEVTPSV
jgi:hypothetical protein